MILGAYTSPGATPGSPYAAELLRGHSNLRFTPELEQEYLRDHLSANRVLIRVACTLTALLTLARGTEQWALDFADTGSRIGLGFVIVSSLLLTAIAWSSAFQRQYLPWARAIVPTRSAVVATSMAVVAAQGKLEVLMLLPMLLIGPFFFLGLGFRTALVSGVLTLVSFATAAVYSISHGCCYCARRRC